MSNTPIKGAALVKKLVEVAKAIKGVKKTGRNEHQHYNYATESDLIDAVRDELFNRNVFVFTSSKVSRIDSLVNTDKDGKTKTSLVTTVETIHTFMDGDSGESYSVSSSGSGHDATDKGVFKAITGATKYFISKTFLIASDDDPENDGEKTALPKPNVKPVGGGLFGGKKAESKKEVVAPTTEVKPPVAAEPPPAPVEAAPTPPPAAEVVAPTPAPAAVLPKPSNGTGTLSARPVFNKNKAANANVKF